MRAEPEPRIATYQERAADMWTDSLLALELMRDRMRRLDAVAEAARAWMKVSHAWNLTQDEKEATARLVSAIFNLDDWEENA